MVSTLRERKRNWLDKTAPKKLRDLEKAIQATTTERDGYQLSYTRCGNTFVITVVIEPDLFRLKEAARG